MSSIIGYENILDDATVVTSSEAAGSGIITYAGANAYDNNTSDHWKPAVVPAYITADGGIDPAGMWLSDIVDGTTDQTFNGNDLTENGTITKSNAGANTGLQAYSGYSSSNYYSQAYNSDLDFGTDDFFFMGWIKKSPALISEALISRAYYSGGYSGAMFQIFAQQNGTLYFAISDDGAVTLDEIISDESFNDSEWTHFYCGRNGLVIEIYIDGKKAASDVTIINATASLDNPLATLFIGRSQFGFDGASDSILSLKATGSTALSASKILDIYNKQKFLFEDNAKVPASYLSAWLPVADYFAIAAHDGFTNSTTFKLQHSDDDISYTTISTITPDVDETKADTFEISGHRYWRVEMSGAIASLGYVALGSGLTLPLSMPVGYTAIHDADDATVINAISENGSFIGRSIISTGKSGTIQINNMTTTFQRANWPKLKAYIQTKPFIFIWDDTKDEAVLCWLKGNVPTPTYSDVTRMTATLQVEGL